MTTLTDRYVHAVLRAIPEAQRDDIDRELRGLIDDAVEDRRAAGADDAERAALVELGDPARLAARYAERPLHLVGPALFPDYVRLLKLLLAIVLPTVVLATSIATALTGAGIGPVVAGAVTTTLTVGVHLCFWTTLVFVLLERTGTASPLVTWDPAALPEPPGPGRSGPNELAASLVALVLWVGALVWQQTVSMVRDATGAAVPVLDPALWSFWLPYLLVVTALEVVFAVALFRAGRWTPRLAVLNVVLAAAAAGPITWLLMTGQVFHAPFFATFGWSDLVTPTGTVTVVSALVVVAVSVWDSVDGFLKLRQPAGGAQPRTVSPTR